MDQEELPTGLAGRCRTLHAYPAPFAPARPGAGGRPASAWAGFARPVPVQAFVALRLFADVGQASRLSVWSAMAIRWWDSVSDASDEKAAVAAVLQLMATVAGDEVSRGNAAAAAASLQLPGQLPGYVQRQMPRALDSLRRELAPGGGDPDAPLLPRSIPGDDAAARARNGLQWLALSGDPHEADRWRVRMFRGAAQRLPAAYGSPTWQELLDAGRTLSADLPPLDAAYGTELAGWSATLSKALRRSEAPGRRRPAMVPPEGTPVGAFADEKHRLPRLLVDAGRNPALAGDLMARHFLRVVFAELFLDARVGFEASTQQHLLQPLQVLLQRLAQDPAWVDAATRTLDALRAYAGFGGTAPLDEGFAATYARVAAQPDGYSAAAHSALRMASRATDEQAPWLDAFRPEAARRRAQRLPTDDGAPLLQRLSQAHDLGLMVADAMRDFLLQCHWRETAGARMPAPDFGTWEQHMRHIPQASLSLQRRADREAVAGLVARMGDPAFVAGVRRIVQELESRVPQAGAREHP